MSIEPALLDALEACHADREQGRSPAEAGFDALLERWPGHPGALEAVAEAYDEAGDLDRAIDGYRAALAGLDGTALRRCFLKLGDALRRAGRFQEAVEALETGLDEFPGSRSLRTFLALALHEQGRSDAALGLVLEVLVDPMPSPDLELFRAAVRHRAQGLFTRDRAA
ncbi:tetratricopeptide repeat protein [Amnibacterium kyonggiense]|uniref:Tetratricopeptide repeat protein n=1 Tax=Amnibacterium kyonggiense TaxID=595671 RepID=A0A4R7FKR3_9MICO|nr:tetratricopeptide repeat protein [Amnibacterium kyonggiense]TDS76960.1 tetratricopeptide repeat protein [Amnibacterium kyonggiense]